jgi:hypothetical protein
MPGSKPDWSKYGPPPQEAIRLTEAWAAFYEHYWNGITPLDPESFVRGLDQKSFPQNPKPFRRARACVHINSVRLEEAGRCFSDAFRNQDLSAYYWDKDKREREYIEKDAWGDEHPPNKVKTKLRSGLTSDAQMVRYLLFERDVIPENSLPYLSNLDGRFVYVDNPQFQKWLETAPTHRLKLEKLNAREFINQIFERWPIGFAPPRNDWLFPTVQRYTNCSRDRYRQLKPRQGAGVSSLPDVSSEDRNMLVAAICRDLVARKK